MSRMNDEKKWYAVYTRPRWEKKVASLLAEKGIVYYCPLHKVNKQWSDRKKIVTEPLFKGYVFVQVAEKNKWDLKLIDGILNYVYWLGKPAVVKEEEIDIIKKFLQEFENVELVNPLLEVNDPVLVKQGIMMDYRGIIIELRGNNARVRIESMGMVLSAVFEKKNLMPLNQATN